MTREVYKTLTRGILLFVVIRNNSVSELALNSEIIRKIEFVHSTHIEFGAHSNLVLFSNFKNIRNNSVSEFAANSEMIRRIEFVFSSHIEFATNSDLVLFPNSEKIRNPNSVRIRK